MDASKHSGHLLNQESHNVSILHGLLVGFSHGHGVRSIKQYNIAGGDLRRYAIPIHIFFFFISLIADGPQYCHPACGL